MIRRRVVDKPSRALALAEGILATTIWASSFVIVKMGLEYMGPLTITGLRYFLGALLFLPFIGRNGNAIRSLSPSLWLRLGLIGLSAYAVGNGAFNLGLKYLPATTVSFLAGFTPVLILFGGIFWLKEIPTRLQIAGLAITLLGSGLFFLPGLGPGEALGFWLVLVGVVAFTFFAVIGREIARDRQTDVFTLTGVPLAIGGGLMLLVAFFLEGPPGFSAAGWTVVFVLAVVNTALAYMLYNHSLQELTALEMNVFFNASPLATAAIAWFLLGEQLGLVQLIGMVTVIFGVTLVQWRRRIRSDL